MLFFDTKNMYNFYVLKTMRLVFEVIKLLLLSSLEKGLIIGAAALLLLIIFVFIMVKANKAKTNKKIKDFIKKYEQANTYLKTNISQAIHRFHKISQLNNDYENHYNYFSEKKDELKIKYISSLNSRVDKIKRLVEEKKYKEIKVFLSESYSELEVFEKEIRIIESEIDEFLNKDAECHNNALNYQNQYREIRNQYDQNKESLSVIDDSINSLFNKIDSIFESFEKLAESAHYEEANEKISSLDGIFEAIHKAFESLPIICARIQFVIPSKINELTSLHSKLDEEAYPLYHLRINATIEDIKNRMNIIKKQVENFVYKNASKYIDEIDEKLETLMNSLQNEIESRVYYDENNESVYQRSYDLEKEFLKLKRILPEYKKIYEIKESYIDLVDDIQKDISSLGNTRRELDNFIHSSNMQPYSILMKKLSDLNDENEAIISKIDHVNGYLKSLKNDSDDAYKLLDKTYLSLKTLEYRLSEANVPAFEEQLKNDFKQAFSALDSIGMLIKITPINVDALNLSKEKLVSAEKRIFIQIEEKIPLMQEAENSIVFANQYRKDFFDVRQALLDAEECFSSADFQKAFNTTVDAIRQVKKV